MGGWGGNRDKTTKQSGRSIFGGWIGGCGIGNFEIGQHFVHVYHIRWPSEWLFGREDIDLKAEQSVSNEDYLR